MMYRINRHTCFSAYKDSTKRQVAKVVAASQSNPLAPLQVSKLTEELCFNEGTSVLHALKRAFSLS
jgi:hypothetical protein